MKRLGLQSQRHKCKTLSKRIETSRNFFISLKKKEVENHALLVKARKVEAFFIMTIMAVQERRRPIKQQIKGSTPTHTPSYRSAKYKNPQPQGQGRGIPHLVVRQGGQLQKAITKLNNILHLADIKTNTFSWINDMCRRVPPQHCILVFKDKEEQMKLLRKSHLKGKKFWIAK